MLAACATDDLKDNVTGNVIDFRATTTKATETTTLNFESFTCTALTSDGFYHFENEEFERTGSYYNSATEYFWPSDGSALSFYAWAPESDRTGGTLTITSSDKKLTGFTVNPNISDQIDFISAKAVGNGNDNASGMELNFNHNLSQIEVKSRSANTGYIYKIKGIRFGNILSSGDFDFETGTWSNLQTLSSYTVEYSTPKTIDELSTSLMKTNGDNAMFIPQDLTPWDPENDPTNTAKGAYIAILARITTNTNAIIYPLVGEYDWIAVPLGDANIGNWESGLRYIYTLDWSTGGGYVYPEKPAYGDGYTGVDIFVAGKKIMTSAIVLGLEVSGWDRFEEDLEM